MLNINLSERFLRTRQRLGSLMFLMTLAFGAFVVRAQEVAVKTNLLYDATTTPNIGVEVGLGGKSSLNIVYGLNPWKFDSDSHGKRFARHWLVMPEYRWWACTRLSGHFLGIHTLGGQMNVANVNIPVPGFFFKGIDLRKAAEDSRLQGYYVGGGLTYGYQFPLSHHWNIEGEIGLGYVYSHYDEYPCGDCGLRLSKGNTNYLGLTKLGLSIMYVF